MIRESTIEKYLIKQVKLHGGYCIKLTRYIGIPDRLVILPNNIILFIELKTATGHLTPLQLKWKRGLEKLGCKHYVLRDKSSIDVTLDQYLKK